MGIGDILPDNLEIYRFRHASKTHGYLLVEVTITKSNIDLHTHNEIRAITLENVDKLERVRNALSRGDIDAAMLDAQIFKVSPINKKKYWSFIGFKANRVGFKNTSQFGVMVVSDDMALEFRDASLDVGCVIEQMNITRYETEQLAHIEAQAWVELNASK